MAHFLLLLMQLGEQRVDSSMETVQWEQLNEHSSANGQSVWVEKLSK